MLFLLGRINWKPACAVWAWNAIGELGALFCHVECLDARGSHWKMPCINLHGMSLVVVVFPVVELILYVELSVEAWSCWIVCGNTVVLVEWMDYVWKHCIRRLKYLSLDIFSLLFFGNNSVRRIVVLVWMTGCMQNACGFDHMFSLLKRCKYSLYSDTMLNYWSTNHC